jgi:ataxia telangiectasia mutated family protein
MKLTDPQGRRLRIPEKVPFRLTNDIVDGLGLTGVDGTFRQCSEHTLRVLRTSSDLILTVLEVFKHDPLYAW